jgi:hypothetical protein
MLSRHDGQETFGQVVTLAESPAKEGLLYAGTDDGNLHVSRDSAKTWKSIIGKVPGVPKGTYVSRVMPSRFAEGTAYATFDGHRSNDYNTYVFITTDFGESWKSLKSDLPAGVTCRVIREHPRNQNLLFLGTEFGAFVSFNRGAQWARLKGNFPLVRVDDIQIHPRDNDLVLGTHGRSVWILDDLTPLEKLSESVLASDAHLFEARAATQYRMYNRRGATGHKEYRAPNPPNGAVINYYLKAKANDPVRLTITDRSGKVVREINGTREAGLNRVVWDLRYGAPQPPGGGPQGGGGRGGGGGGRGQGGQQAAATAEGQEPAPPAFGGGGGFGGGARGPRVAPGDYTLKLSAAGKQLTGTVRVEEDPRIQISAADRQKWEEALTRIYSAQRSAQGAQRSLQNLRTQITSMQESLRRTGNAPEAVNAEVKAVGDKLEQLQRSLVPVFDGSGSAGPALPGTPRPLIGRLGQLFNALDGYTAAPTPEQLTRIEGMTKELTTIIADLNKMIEESIPNLNNKIREGGVSFINPGQKVEPPK